MLVGHGEIVAVPALADLALSRGQQVHDDLLPRHAGQAGQA